jgi:hypothetical protein
VREPSGRRSVASFMAFPLFALVDAKIVDNA